MASEAHDHDAKVQPRPTRERGKQLERVNAFSDGVFTIAATLLVLSIELPTGPADELGGKLADLLDPTFSYFLSFAVIGRFWLRHHELFGRLRFSDQRFAALNLVFLAFIAILPAPTELLGRYPDRTEPVVIYAANLIVLTLLLRMITKDAVDRGLTNGAPLTSKVGRDVGLWVIGVFAVSIPVAFVVPRAAVYIWIVAAFAPMVSRRLNRGKRDDRGDGAVPTG